MEEMNGETLKKICSIARIKLGDGDAHKFIRQFRDIFGFFSSIEDMDIVEKADELPNDNFLREDETESFGDTILIINEFPKKKDGLNIVPRNL
jgi:aspartyl/glutamyl-tRNA(Asn/Gln) amidotransferase C subunit